MRNKIVSIGIFIIVVLFASLHIFINLRGKPLLQEKFKQVFKRPIIITRLSTSFPININIEGLEAEGLFKIDKLVLKGGFFDIFKNRFHLSSLEIEHPVVTLKKQASEPEPEKPAVIQQAAALLNNKLPVKKESKTLPFPKLNPSLPGLDIRRLIVNGGSINYIDNNVDNNGLLIKAREVYLKVENFNLNIPGPQITSFQLRADIPWKDDGAKGRVDITGWINLLKKDMQAEVKVQDIDGFYLYPYYSQWVSLEKTRIQKVKLNFSSNINGLNNDVTAKCHLELTDIEFKERAPEEQLKKEERIAHAVLDIFKAMDQGKIVVDFTIHTKMDKPLFSLVPLAGAVENKLASSGKLDKPKVQDVAVLPIKILEGIIKSTADLSKAAIDGTFAVGNELGKSVAASFKKEK